MLSSFQFLLVLQCLILSSTSLMMIDFWGTVESKSAPEVYSGTWNDCMSRCYWRDDCVAIQEPEEYACLLFPYGTVSSVQKSNNRKDYKVGVKRNITNCPAKSASIFGDESTTTETYQTETLAYQYTINSATVNGITVLSYTSNYYIECPNGSIVSVRGPNQICITVRLFPKICQNWKSALELCKSDENGISLTGPYSKEESRRIDTELLKDVPRRSGFSSVVWLDGWKDSSGNRVWMDSSMNGTTFYKWSYFQNNYCAFAETGKGVKFQAQDCTLRNGATFCFYGALCKVMPFVQY